VLERLRKYRLYAKISKCSFEVDTVNFLGFVVSPHGIQMEESRIEAIRKWPEPTCVKDVQVFLGFANFYRRFIEAYSRVVTPLTDLTKGSRVLTGKALPVFIFTKEARRAFEELKERFTSAPILVHHDPRRRIRIESDASGFAVAAILSELCDDGQWHPIAFWSRKMTDPETRYEVHDCEMLAIFGAFKQWRHYLEGTRHPIVVLTDHANLQYFMTTKELTRRQARWAEELAAYDFVIEHRSGKTNPADAPSRRPDYAQGFPGEGLRTPPELRPIIAAMAVAQGQAQSAKAVDNPESHAQVQDTDMDESRTAGVTGILEHLVPRLLVNAAMESETAYHDMPEPMGELLLRLQRRDAFATEQLEKLPQAPVGRAERSPWERSKNGLLRYEGKAYVPADPAVRAEILRMNHDDPQGGHFGQKRTLEAVRRKYYWHGMAQDVKNHILTCDSCQRCAVHRHKEYGQLEPLPLPSGPMEWVTLDFITGLPPSKWRGGVYDAVLVLVETFTKFAVYIPCRKDIDAPELAELMYDRFVSFLGMPQNLVSDRDTLFTSKFWSSLCYYLGAKRKLSTAYHPQTDGQTERQNQTLEHYLRLFINFQQDDWARWLPLAMHTYNTSVHSTTGMAPMEALMAFRGDLRINVSAELPEGNAPSAQERVKEMEEMRKDLITLLAHANETQKKYYDQKHKPMSFRIGDRVMVRAKNFRMIRPSRKLDHRQLGPFTIVDAWGKQAYKLKLTPQFGAIHPVFHVALLEPYRKRKGEPDPEDPTLVDGHLEWNVERILTHRKFRRKIQYLVRWEGYTPADDSWEPEGNLTGAQETLQAYKKKHKL
jgi:transposase InsO family protein